MLNRKTTRLIFWGVVTIVLASCDTDPSAGVPGGQVVARSSGRGEVLDPRPIEIRVDGLLRTHLDWNKVKGLHEESFGTGLEDVQTGYPLVDVLSLLDIRGATAVTLYGAGLQPVVLGWGEISDRKNKVLLGVTHKGTAKVVAGNPRVLNRDGWVRHLQRIDVSRTTQPPMKDGRGSEPGRNPLHPRKKTGEGP